VRKMRTFTPFYVLVILVLAVSLLTGACAEPAPTPAPTPAPAPAPKPEPTPAPAPVEPIELRLNIAMPPTAVPYTGAVAPWIEEVSELTGGQVKIITHFAGQLGPPDKVFESLVSGMADIGVSYCQMNPGRFSALEVMYFPKSDQECAHPSRVAWELYQKSTDVQSQFADTKVLSIAAVAPYPPGSMNLATIDKPIYTLDDVKGLKLHAPGHWVGSMVELLGGAPVSLFIGDLYTSLEKGIVDGGVFGPMMLEEYKLNELMHHWTIINIGYMPLYLTMNWDAWNSLPPDVQKVFEERSGPPFLDRMDKSMWECGQEGFDRAITEYGLEVIELPPDELARWNETVLAPVQDEYVAEMESKGIPGRELLELADQLYAKYAK